MMDAQKATAGAVQSVERAFDILEIMASAGGPTGVSELTDLSIDCGARAADRGVLVSKGTLAPTRCRGIQAVGSGLSGQETAWEMAKCAAVACRAQGKAEPPGDRFEMAPAQFVNEWQQPLFAGHFDCWVAVGKPAQCVVPLVVGCEHRVPGSCDGGVDAHPGRQLVVGGLCPRIGRSLARGMASLGSPVPTIRTERGGPRARSSGGRFGQKNVHAKNIRRWQEFGGYAAATDKPHLPDVLIGGCAARRRLSRSGG